MGRQVIKDFIKGLVTDGDSPDMPINSMRTLRNMDIDYSSQRLFVRYPYKSYSKLTSTSNQSSPNHFPAPADYYLYWVLKYDVGIELLQRNTMLIFRHKTAETSWWIYDNAPNGGDGFKFEPIAAEVASQCYPVAVNGNVRIALGNGRDYKIFMPHTNLKYFKKVDGTYIVTNFSTTLNATVCKYFGTPTFSKTYIYLDGKLTPNLLNNTDTLTLSNYVQGGGPLEKGEYSFILAPLFDTNPTQYGAPVDSETLLLAKDFITQQATTNVLTDSYTYKVNDLPVYNYVKRVIVFNRTTAPKYQSISYNNYVLEFDSTVGKVIGINMSSRYHTSTTISTNPRNMVRKIASNGDITYEWTIYTLAEDKELQFEVYYPSGGSGFPYTNSEFTVSSVNGTTVDVKIRNTTTGALDPTNTFTISGAIPYKPVLTIDQPTGYDVMDTMPFVNTNGNPLLFDYATRFINGPNTLIDNTANIFGEAIRLSLSISTDNFNPRLISFGIFCKKTTTTSVEADYSLIKVFPVREVDSNEDWTLSGGVATYSLDVTADVLKESLGFWSVLYATGDGGFRPYSHTLEDITRRFGLLVNRKERMFAGQISDDEGQSIVAYTPVASGHGQMDVWFKPLIAFTDGSESNLWGIEFQDRLMWFQRNGIWHMDVGDKPRFEYQFHGVYRGTGCPMPKTVAKGRDAVFFANYDGIFRFNSSGLVDMSLGRINDYWRYEVSQRQKDYAVGGYNPKSNEYWLIIPTLTEIDSMKVDPIGTIDPNVDYVPGGFAQTVQEAYNPDAKAFSVLVWDNDEYYGQYWREYTTAPVESTDSKGKPVMLFSDRNNDWIFVDVDNNAYFWAGDKNEGPDPNNVMPTDEPEGRTEYAVATQNFGERSFDFITERIHIITNPTPNDSIDVTIVRDTVTPEVLTFPKANRRPRKLARRRCSTIQIGIGGNQTGGELSEVREIIVDYFEDMKRP